MNHTPFTVYLRFVPWRGKTAATPATGAVVVGKSARNDYIRDAEKISMAVYQELEDNASNVVLPKPGSGQTKAISLFGGIQPGVAWRPQAGDKPALLVLEAFYSNSSGNSFQPVDSRTVFHANSLKSGYQVDNTATVNATTLNSVKALVAELNAALAGVEDSTGDPPTIHRLIYKGIVFGVGGHHFPV